MESPGRESVSRRVLVYEGVAFLSIILFIWLDELLDLPRIFFGAEATPINWRESLVESVVIAIVGIVIVYYTHRIFERMKYLEGILPVCASCKKIRDQENKWHQIESYIRDRTDADFSHSICPECAARLYPGLDLFPEKKKTKGESG
ncbi:hypothetical protein [Desulfopila aestuarii]|uniref:Uncharacterized protein n=1 Tax=Desulfopila aestuarii DSM 18488 TaxID=1121416 RepID=A0A1M7Y9L0_9BACT|nr:hypothetical protein [Desulfopila aestuarii]SHO49307.1 hypothetical protein SAMN02745220_02790 [Desulfopila aestuarii DSM 18488]